MKVCVLVSDYNQTNFVFEDVDAPKNPAIYDKKGLYTFIVVPIHKRTTAKQIADLAKSKSSTFI